MCNQNGNEVLNILDARTKLSFDFVNIAFNLCFLNIVFMICWSIIFYRFVFM